MIKIKNLKKSYRKKDVLKSINFTLKKGEIKALIGTNGSGKSTLIEIICGIRKFSDGEIIVADLDVRNRKNKVKLNHVVGYMPQSFCMFNDLTVYENLLYVCSLYNIDKSKIAQIMDTCYLTEYKDFLAGNLSGGYKQLLSIATVIIHDPKVLILDEPTSAMDPLFRKKFWKIVKSYNKSGVTVLIVTHYIEELLECDTFSLLSDGKIVFDGNVKEFKENGFINIEEILKKYETRKTNE